MDQGVGPDQIRTQRFLCPIRGDSSLPKWDCALSRTPEAVLEGVLRRDRAALTVALFALVVIAWAYVLWLAADMEMGGMDMAEFRMIPAGLGLMMPATAPWQPIEFGFVFAMW